MLSGIELSRGFFDDVVRPLADAAVGADHYAAALIGPGSEVLGYDDETSADHDWGPRVQLFISSDEEWDAMQPVREALPETYAGHSLGFGGAHGGAPWIHALDVVSVGGMGHAWIGFDPLEPVDLVDWLSAPSNGLLMLTAGAVFHDGTGDLTAARHRIAWYPDDLWRWLLGCQWRRIGQEQAFVARTAELGDDLGSQMIASRLVRDCIRLAFLIDRRHAPYSKWLGRAFAELPSSRTAAPAVARAQLASDPRDRQAALCDAYEALGLATLGTGLVADIDPARRPFHEREIVVGPADDFANALLAGVQDERLRRLRPHGAIDQVMDSTDADWHLGRPLYTALLAPSRDL
ncbi:MAG TPA: DUF4037 domain-containing protein [Acidimicrobiales bacterium]|nr:DUF4037 domain-containing protein [Acidimicrobiales bacterium]